MLGRFLSLDTIVPNPGNPQDLNRYSYAANNPLRYTDPTGHYQVGERWGGTEVRDGIAYRGSYEQQAWGVNFVPYFALDAEG